MTKQHETDITITSDAGRKFVSMANAAAKKATECMLQLTEGKITILIDNVEIKHIQRTYPGMKAETDVAGIYLPVTGEIDGAALLVLPKEVAFLICDVLLKKEMGVTHKLTPLDISALTEVGNILCGSFLTVFSNTMQIKIVEHAPSFSFDMFGAVVDTLIAQMAEPVEETMVIEVRFAFEHTLVRNHALFILGMQNIQAILKRVDKG